MCPYNKTWFSRNTDLFWQCFKNRCRVRYSRIHINNGKFHCVSASGKFYSVSASTMSWQLSHYLTMAMRELSNRRLVPLNTMRKTLTNSTPLKSPKRWRNLWAAWVHWGHVGAGVHVGADGEHILEIWKISQQLRILHFSDFLIGKKRKSVISYKKTWVDRPSIPSLAEYIQAWKKCLTPHKWRSEQAVIKSA